MASDSKWAWKTKPGSDKKLGLNQKVIWPDHKGPHCRICPSKDISFMPKTLWSLWRILNRGRWDQICILKRYMTEVRRLDQMDKGRRQGLWWAFRCQMTLAWTEMVVLGPDVEKWKNSGASKELELLKLTRKPSRSLALALGWMMVGFGKAENTGDEVWGKRFCFGQVESKVL